MKPELPKDENEIRALARTLALGYLNRRETSAQGLRTYLVGKRKIPSAITEPLIEDLKAQGWLSDNRYARLQIRNLLSQSKGPQAILLKLRQKGILMTTEELRLLIEEISPQHQEWQSARQWALRRYPEALHNSAQKRRAFQALIRRGFSFETASQALSTSERDD